MENRGRSLELYFIDGTPEGMLTAEVFNWTGHVLMVPRTQITQALERKESNYTGVYLLLGEHEGDALAYIGEGEDISYRLRTHDAKKEWWSKAILVTSSANHLNKAHVKYLEARLIEEARSIGRMALENGNTPARPSLSEAAIANMESFLDYLLMVLPALRVDMFIRNTRPTKALPATAQPSTSQIVFEVINSKMGLNAIAVLENGELIVQKGSTARGEWVGAASVDTSYGNLYSDLKRMGILSPQGRNLIFTESYAFKSPSAAGAVVMGRSTNGTTKWKLKGTNITYKDWEAEQLGQPNI